jgi:glycyl-tRNA synthetase
VLFKAAQWTYQTIKALGLGLIAFEDLGNIGKSYRRHDEIGTPLCVTIDFNSLTHQSDTPNLDMTVTVRERDTLHQTRVPLSKLLTDLPQYFQAPQLASQ